VCVRLRRQKWLLASEEIARHGRVAAVLNLSDALHFSAQHGVDGVEEIVEHQVWVEPIDVGDCPIAMMYRTNTHSASIAPTPTHDARFGWTGIAMLPIPAWALWVTWRAPTGDRVANQVRVAPILGVLLWMVTLAAGVFVLRNRAATRWRTYWAVVPAVLATAVDAATYSADRSFLFHASMAFVAGVQLGLAGLLYVARALSVAKATVDPARWSWRMLAGVGAGALLYGLAWHWGVTRYFQSYAVTVVVAMFSPVVLALIVFDLVLRARFARHFGAIRRCGHGLGRRMCRRRNSCCCVGHTPARRDLGEL
jgi:hypothetical protein